MRRSALTIVLSAVLALAVVSSRALAKDGWGASWSFGPTTSRIIHAKTTIVPGRLPPITSSTGPLFLWPGLSNPMSDLVQTTIDAWPDNKNYCGAAAGQWCVEASVFGSFGQRNGPTVAVDPDDHITIEYTLESDGNTWTQTVSSQKLGKVVSTLQSTSGQMPKGGFGFATEADADAYTIDTQYYLCTELDFAEADPHFGATGVGGVGAKMGATGMGSGIGTAKNLRTPDGGRTWLVDLITLPAMNPQGPQTPPPTYDCANGSGASGSGGASGGSDMAGQSGAADGGAAATAGHQATAGKAAAGGAGMSASGGALSTGGNASAASGGAGHVADAGSGAAANHTSGAAPAPGGSNAPAANGGSGGLRAEAGNGAASEANTLANGSGQQGGCACSAPGRDVPARGFAVLALAGAALALRSRRRERG